MAGTTINITDAGRAALVNADHTGTAARKIVQAGIATAPFAFDPGLQALPNEHKRLATISGETIAADTVHATIQDDSADQYTTYGFGLYLDNGVLLGTYCQPTPILEKSPVAILLMAVDMVFKELDVTALSFGDATFTNPPASTERHGVVELATQAEVDAGADGVRAITPKTAAARYAALTGATFTGAVRAPELKIDGDMTLTGLSGATLTTADVDGLSIDAYDRANAAIKKPILLAPSGGRVLIGMSHGEDDASALLQVAGVATAATPPAGDNSTKVATTEWVLSVVSRATVGQIIFEPRISARAGCLKLNGALLLRADYPALWGYAKASGALVSEAQWNAGSFGCFSSGDGATTFRIPELRGEHIRCWDDGRGVDLGRAIGSWQDSQNRSHDHTASSGAAGDHVHPAWTDVQGWHGHHGTTAGAGSHAHGITHATTFAGTGSPVGAWVPGTGYNHATDSVGDHAHVFDTDGAGNHGHNIGMHGSGNHSHSITVNAAGGPEVRVRTVAMLAMIRAF